MLITKIFNRQNPSRLHPKILSRRFGDSVITSVKAREVLDSNGYPTIETEVRTEKGVFRGISPSGTKHGIYEAFELRDGDSERYAGMGVQKAVENVNEVIGPALVGKDALNQFELDSFMIEELDGSKNEFGWAKKNLGGNAILSVSLAVARAGAKASKLPLYKYIAKMVGEDTDKFVIPVPQFNLVNGGLHATNSLPFQEFMIMPVGASSYKEAVRIGSECYFALKKILTGKYINSGNVGMDGGLVPDFESNKQTLDCLVEAIELAGHSQKVLLAIDIAATCFYDEETQLYNLGFVNSESEKKRTYDRQDMIDLYARLKDQYPLVSVEDPFDQDDFESYAGLHEALGDELQIVGDDLLATNIHRIKKALKEKACNAMLLKYNNIGSLSESIKAANAAQNEGWGVIASHRAGDSEDTFVCDLAVGIGAGQVKLGAPARGERTSKHNQIIRIEEELGDAAVYAGADFRDPFSLL